VCLLLSFHAQARRGFKGLFSELLQHVDVSAHFIFVRTKDDGGILVDEIGFVGLAQRLVEAMPAEGAARFDDLLKSAVFAFAVALSQHKPFFTTKVSEVLFAKFMSGPGRDPAQAEEHLTKREREIIQLIAEGASNKEVAQKLGVSLRTAETHRANVLRKLNLSSVADLVRYAIRNNIVQA